MPAVIFIAHSRRLGRKKIRLRSDSPREFIADRIFHAFACEALEKCSAILVYQPQGSTAQTGEYVFQLSAFTIPFSTGSGLSERVRVRRICRWERIR